MEGARYLKWVISFYRAEAMSDLTASIRILFRLFLLEKMSTAIVYIK
jgi:hypothetical protein